MRFRLKSKRVAVTACLLIASSMFFSCARVGDATPPNVLTQSQAHEDTTASGETQGDITPSESEPLEENNESSVISEASSITSSPASSAASSKPASSVAASSKPASSAAASSKPTSSAAASSKPASSAAASSKPTSSAMASSKPTSSAAASSKPASSAAASSKAPSSSDGGFYSGIEKEILTQLNDLRASLGLPALKSHSQLTEGARIRAKEMFDNNYFAHSRPDGSNWDTVFTKDVPLSGYRYLGENLAKTVGMNPDASYMMDMWINSQGHYENMVRDVYTHVGIGVYAANVPGKGMTTYAVQEFGTF